MENLFIHVSEFAWLLISPPTFAFLWLCGGIFLLWIGKFLLARAFLTVLALSALFIGLFPVGEWLTLPLENQHPPNPPLDDVDGIIVLAGPEDAILTEIWDQVSLSRSAERNLTFMQLSRRFPNAKLLFSGGSGTADVAERLFVEQGLDAERIIFERDSRNTYESALLAESLVNPRSDQTWLLITSGWHMPRSVATFCKVGWRVTAYPVDFRSHRSADFRIRWNPSLELISLAVKEWIGLFVYRVTGRSC